MAANAGRNISELRNMECLPTTKHKEKIRNALCALVVYSFLTTKSTKNHKEKRIT